MMNVTLTTPRAAVADRTLLGLPDDILRAIIARIGVPLRGPVEGLAPALQPALALADTHPSLAAHIAAALAGLSLTFSASAAPAQAPVALAAVGDALRSLALVGPHEIPHDAWRALLAAPAVVRTLSLSRLPGLDDSSVAKLIRSQPLLEDVTVVAVPGFGPAAASALVSLPKLTTLTLEDLPRLPFASAGGVIRCAGGKLTSLSLRLRHPLARFISRHCTKLDSLALAMQEDPNAVVAVCVASAGHLRSAVFAVPLLAEGHLRAIVSSCPRLDELYAAGVAPRVQADVVGHRLRRLDLFLGAVDIDTVRRLAVSCTRVAHLRVVGGDEANPALMRAVVDLVASLGAGLESLILRDVPGLDDAGVTSLGQAAGCLRLLSVDGLNQVSATGLEGLVRCNGRSLAHVSIGTKCRLLTTVAIMRVLAKHCTALQAVSFPRWSIMKRSPPQPSLERAYADFRNAAPNASIVAG